ncbi:family 16 glycosylhydrolase [Leisingera daeponensis]|uniref:Beta-glucanase n=1 Tax=Leisingera daeponensis TaxID=405746 RepID=A0ABS7NMU0_9RHOB|nr:family 16 glycosylhydrolase [Leisingera daeponensis]MBY6141999.1 family 16 glycosylhydrolase [Leisingera daeponensis]
MNLNRTRFAVHRLAVRMGHGFRSILPRQKSRAFGRQQCLSAETIEKVYVINLDREPDRWARVRTELRRVRDTFGGDLLALSERHPAVDARSFLQDPPKSAAVDPFYTLADQLFVEPQPQTLPTRFELDEPIRMSRAEVAVARSHIEIWRKIANGSQEYALILEDDVWFHPSFARHLDKAWKDIADNSDSFGALDLLYVSYMEATNGAPKNFVSNSVFRPERGLWYLSGYVLSRQGAKKLLRLLPCRGPVDLWINQKFSELNVYATRCPIVRQRTDSFSTNSYSILPALTTIGAIDSEGAALFNSRPTRQPVFSFGPPNSGQSSLAMALSMLGYRCCSDLDMLPTEELNQLSEGSSDRVFNAYVNVGCLEPMIEDLRSKYPNAKFILTASPGSSAGPTLQDILDCLEGADVITLDTESITAWRVLCEHLRCVPPFCSFPSLEDLGQRPVADERTELTLGKERALPKWDRSPWVVEADYHSWSGIRIEPPSDVAAGRYLNSCDVPGPFDSKFWSKRSDTFTGNAALFRPENVKKYDFEGVSLHVQREELGVRKFSAGAVTSHADFSYGRFEATLQASSVPGVVTGFFLHRNSPHQEIDIEIPGNAPNRLIVNVFYNPGNQGAQFDYGYRGSPMYIELGFDASKGMHQYAIEWTPHEIRWLVDDALVHRRVLWNPTPIPHLPMKLHLNAWPSRSYQLAGRLSARRLPAKAYIHSIRVQSYDQLPIAQEVKTSMGSGKPVNCGASK